MAPTGLLMKRWSTGILAAVIVFVAGIALVMAFRDRGPHADPREPTVSAADYRIKEVRLREESRNGMRWQLDADQAEVFESTGKTTLRKIVIKIEDKAQTWTVTGDEGDLAGADKDIELRGNVVVASSDGLRLETSRLQWDGKSERAWTDAPVTLYRSGVVVTGRGLEAKIGDETVTITSRVRATLTPAAAVGKRSP
jgi:LPS export ABC transporter protein LptC